MDLQEHFKRTFLNIVLCNRTLREILNISPEHPWNEHEMAVVTSGPISFFRVSLHYTFVAEYCKLLAPLKAKYNNNNASSLYRINQACRKAFPDFKDQFEQNILELDSIRSHPYSREIKDLRDKKLLHSDSEIKDPETFTSLTLAEIETGFQMILRMSNVLKTCTRPMEFSFHLDIPDDDYRTEVFIHNHAIVQANPRLLVVDFYKRRQVPKFQ